MNRVLFDANDRKSRSAVVTLGKVQRDTITSNSRIHSRECDIQREPCIEISCHRGRICSRQLQR